MFLIELPIGSYGFIQREPLYGYCEKIPGRENWGLSISRQNAFRFSLREQAESVLKSHFAKFSHSKLLRIINEP